MVRQRHIDSAVEFVSDRKYFSIPSLMENLKVSRPTAMNILRELGAMGNLSSVLSYGKHEKRYRWEPEE